MTRRVPLIFWIVLFSFLIRIAFILWVPSTSIHPEGDDASYYQLTALQWRDYFQKGGVLLKDFLAGRLFHGGGMLERYGLEIPWGAFERGLTYPLFLALVFWILGPNPLIVFILQAFLISLSCGLTYEIAKELKEPQAGLLGAVLMGIYPPFIFITSQLFQENLAIFLFSLFYFLAFQSYKKDSAWLYGVTGMTLFFLSLSRPSLAFFPFFLMAGAVGASLFLKRKFSLRRFWLLPVSFLIPYGIWGAIVSWQFHHPAIFVTPVGKAMLPAVLPDYDGWMPDGFLASRPDSEIARILQREGILETSQKGEWPPKPTMVKAALKTLWRHPWLSFRMGLDKFRRLWWRPYDWPWREFLFPPEPLRWFHRFLVVAALMGGALWLFERPLAACFLSAPFFYSMLPHVFFHIESRYGLPWLTFVPLLAGFSVRFLYSPVFSRGRFMAVAVTLISVIAIPFIIHVVTRPDRYVWETRIHDSTEGVRQEIFLPPGDLEGSLRQNLRMDLKLPPEGDDWEIQINGKSIGTLESLKANPPDFLLIPTYSIHLKDARKKPFEVRQWFSLPIPSGILKEGAWNAVEIHAGNEGRRANSGAIQWTLFGDSPLSSPTPVFSGPLFHRSMVETSVYSFFYNGDFRLNGMTPLHHQGVKASYQKNRRSRFDDLSPSPGIQKGEYRIRIEVERSSGEFRVY